MDWLDYLRDQLEVDLDLLKKLEDKLRVEDNPRQELKWEGEIKEIKIKIETRKQDINKESIKKSENKIINTKIASLSDIPVTGFEASEVGADYTILRDLLSTKKFKEADEETFKKMLWAVRRENEGFLEENNVLKFPCRDLRTIDQLWLASSGGKFGLSVQKQIYLDIYKNDQRAFTDKTGEKLWEFAERVEWIAGSGRGEQPIYDLRATIGHLPQKYLHEYIEKIFLVTTKNQRNLKILEDFYDEMKEKISEKQNETLGKGEITDLDLQNVNKWIAEQKLNFEKFCNLIMIETEEIKGEKSKNIKIVNAILFRIQCQPTITRKRFRLF